eukprot:220085-Amorphochlora_amoeboformis.AAC.1
MFRYCYCISTPTTWIRVYCVTWRDLMLCHAPQAPLPPGNVGYPPVLLDVTISENLWNLQRSLAI